MNRDIIYRAMHFAIEAHEDQIRDGGEAYIMHPAQVARLCEQVTDNPVIIAAAWLHDTVEDTDVTFEELAEEFGFEIANLVMEVTHVKQEDKTTYFPRLHSQNGVILKFADRLSNLSQMNSWSDNRKQAYINKSKFWASSADEAQKPTKEY